MISRIYVESSVQDLDRTQRMIDQFSGVDVFEIDEYQEVFNRKSQDFRLQKQDPALVLAEKQGNFVLETPDYCNLGESHRFYYFSHMMNCIYDCRYCFLQGMYDSAHYVVFVNFDDFFDAIEETAQNDANRSPYFFSGHVNDSLALDQVTGFSEEMLSFFRGCSNSMLNCERKVFRRIPYSSRNRLIVAWSHGA